MSTAALLCGICNETFTTIKVLPCGHVLCDSCWISCENVSMTKGKCPYCRRVYKAREAPYPLFADLVVEAKNTSDIIQQTRQRVEHLVDGLGVMKSAEELREVYTEFRHHRAEIRNLASGSRNRELDALANLLTHTVDALEDTLLESLGKQGLVTKARDAAKQLSEQKQSHEREIRELKEAISKLKSKRKLDDDERKVTASKLASYKKKYADAVSEQSLQEKRAAELSGRLDELRKEFDRTKDEHKHFQSQLFEHKTNETKYKQQIRQLKQELKAMKEKEIQAPVALVTDPVRLLSPPTPLRGSQEDAQEDLSIIDLCSSSPTKSPAAHTSRKRPRAPDENQYRRSKDLNLLPPPKVRAGGPSRVRNEVLENVTVGTNGTVKKKPITSLSKPSTSSSVLRAVQPSSKSKGPQLGIGKGGKLVGIAKKRVRAV